MNNHNNAFPYHIGVQSLHELANKHSRVCVMNIRGTESSLVTPVSHAYSGGNVVAGVQYGESGGVFETTVGDIPVYGSISDVIRAGVQFDTGVIYLPPTAVSHAVSEMCARNVNLKRIIIVTEKVPVRDSRLIRYGCQNRKVDVIGANTLGIANSWDQVRIGGALGGDCPGESLKKGSVAIYSNSGNFSTTISEYLKTAGFGTSTILSSGKDVYIHFALAEFLYCAENDPRTKAIVVYVEPGGYYEKQALDWIEQGRFNLTKPVIACVTGRWKKNLTRSCGHAGAMAGSGDDAEAKEGWFDRFFGVPVFDAGNPAVSSRGVRIRTIQDVPGAVAACMELLGEHPDFQPTGDLSLKPWFANDQGMALPAQLKMYPVRAISPYGEEIEKVNKLIGARIIREPMRNRSSASSIDPADYTIYLHGRKLLDFIDQPFGAVCIYSVLKTMPEESRMAVINPLLNWFTARGSMNIETASRGRENGCTPNAYIAAEVLLAGNNRLFQDLQSISSWLVDQFFHEAGADLAIDEELIERKCTGSQPPPRMHREDHSELWAEYFGSLLRAHGQETLLTRFAEAYAGKSLKTGETTVDPCKLLLSAILMSLAWKPLVERRISRGTAQDLGTYLGVNGIIVGMSPVNPGKNEFWQKLHSLADPAVLDTEFSSTCFQVMFSRVPEKDELFTFNALLNLTVTNGPGTLSSKGAKESVSARNHIATTYAGFMTNTGLAHGGNGFEAVSYLLKAFAQTDPYRADAGDRDAALKGLAIQSAQEFAMQKKKNKSGVSGRIPSINHPVFRGKQENHDPREVFLRDLLGKKGIVNPFLEFYHHLVKELYAEEVTGNIYCVNVDAAIACIALDLFWNQLHGGELSEKEAQEIVFTMFLYGRMAGVSAEIADHLGRGLDLDCRTPAEELVYLS